MSDISRKMGYKSPFKFNHVVPVGIESDFSESFLDSKESPQQIARKKGETHEERYRIKLYHKSTNKWDSDKGLCTVNILIKWIYTNVQNLSGLYWAISDVTLHEAQGEGVQAKVEYKVTYALSSRTVFNRRLVSILSLKLHVSGPSNSRSFTESGSVGLSGKMGVKGLESGLSLSSSWGNSITVNNNATTGFILENWGFYSRDEHSIFADRKEAIMSLELLRINGISPNSDNPDDPNVYKSIYGKFQIIEIPRQKDKW